MLFISMKTLYGPSSLNIPVNILHAVYFIIFFTNAKRLIWEWKVPQIKPVLVFPATKRCRPLPFLQAVAVMSALSSVFAVTHFSPEDKVKLIGFDDIFATFSQGMNPLELLFLKGQLAQSYKTNNIVQCHLRLPDETSSMHFIFKKIIIPLYLNVGTFFF